MALIAGVDIGNSTTEIVIAEGKTPVAWARRSTRGQKGSEASVRAAEALLRNMERQNGMSTDRVIVAPWHPVTTEVATLHEAPPDTGNLQIINCANHSVAGNAWAVGQPWNVSDIPPRGISLVAVVETGTGYRNAAALINHALEHGVSICGVIAADDEAVLIDARLTEKMPVVDRANCQNALRARKLFVEVRPVGQCVSTATDVWALHSALETREQDVAHLNLICRWVRDLSAVVIGLFDQPIEPQALHHMSTATWCTGESMDLIQAIPLLPGRLVGSVCVLNLGKPMQTSDVWGIDIDSVIENRGVRINGHLHRMALASMSTAAHASQVSIRTISSRHQQLWQVRNPRPRQRVHERHQVALRMRSFWTSAEELLIWQEIIVKYRQQARERCYRQQWLRCLTCPLAPRTG